MKSRMLQQFLIIICCLSVVIPITAQNTQSSGFQSDSLVRLSPVLNSRFEENSPFLAIDGRTLYFSRQGHPRNFGQKDAGDIWVTFRQAADSWSRPVNLGAPVNTIDHDRIAGVNAAGTRLYVISDPGRPVDSAYIPLHVIPRQGRSWLKPESMLIQGYYNISTDSDFFVSADEQILLLSVERENGAGSRDLYVSFPQADGSWSRPESLGPGINTSGEERHAVLAADNQTLYFSSNGYPGMGGTDIFMSQRLEESWARWSPPTALGRPINTAGDDDDFTLAAAGKPILLSRKADSTGMDLFRSLLPDALQPVSVVLIKGQLQGQPGDITIHQLLLREKERAQGQTALKKDGSFRFILPAQSQAVNLFAKGGDSFSISQTITLAGPDPETLDWAAPENMALLEVNENYQRRETEIAILADQLMTLDKECARLDYQLNTYAEIKASTLGLDRSEYLNYPQVVALEPQYQALEKSISQRSATTSTDDRTRLGYASFCKGIWTLMVDDLLPQLKAKIDKEVALDLLKEQQAAKRTDDGLIKFLEEHLNQIPPVDSSLVFDPHYVHFVGNNLSLTKKEELAKELQLIFHPLILNKLQAELPYYAATALTDEVRYHRKNVHRMNLQKEFELKLKQQLEFEGNTISSVLPVPPERPTAAPENPAFSEIQVTLKTIPFEPGQIIPLNGLLFMANSTRLLPESTPHIDRLAAWLKKMPQTGIEIRSYTHKQMPHLQAKALTEARAHAVAERIITTGIDPKRLRPMGYGKAFSLNENDSPEERHRNQRTEILIFRLD